MRKFSLLYDKYESPVGVLYLTFSGKYLTAVSFSKPADIAYKKGGVPKSFLKEMASYFNGTNSEFTPEIKFLSGTDFERKVWDCLKRIPYGETRTYGWVAEKAGNPAATRAVGRALSKNPVAIVLPCHRVIESDGSTGGYSSGVNIKIRLLELEYYSNMKHDMD
jgi:methylated-DNA-[protein]-cysteine S-methyltransferase